MTGKDLNLAAKKLLDGGVVAFPTETVMGLGVIYDNFDAYNRLNKIKGRPEGKPYTMMLSRVEEINIYANISETAKKVIDAFLPGPLTVLLKSKENVPGWVTHNTGVIGIRVPNFPLVNELLNLVGKPLLVPSANPSNLPPATKVNEVVIYFNVTLDYIVNNDSLQELPSTIVDLTTDEVKILRQGKISKKEILESIGEEK